MKHFYQFEILWPCRNDSDRASSFSPHPRIRGRSRAFPFTSLFCGLWLPFLLRQAPSCGPPRGVDLLLPDRGIKTSYHPANKMSSGLRYNDDMQKQTKILYVITKSNWGGAQRYVYDLAANLPKDEFGVKVAAGGTGMLFEKLKNAGIPTIHIASFQREINPLKEVFALIELAKIFLRENPDIVHLNSSKAGGIGAVAAKLASLLLRKRIRVIFTVHGWGFLEPRPQWQNTAIRLASAMSAWLQDKLIIISHSDLRASGFVSHPKLVFIPLGIEKPNLYAREDARHIFSQQIRKPVKNEELVIGTIAELTKNKGLAYLIDAGEILRNAVPRAPFRMFIIGEGEKRKELEAKIEKAGLQDTVHLLGFLPEASRLLSGFDMFVLPSLKEGLPYTIMEASSADLPVVATAIGGIPDIVGNQKSGILVPPGDAVRLANAVKTLMLKTDARTKMGRAGSEKIAKQFSLSRMIRETDNAYRQCLNNTNE